MKTIKLSLIGTLFLFSCGTETKETEKSATNSEKITNPLNEVISDKKIEINGDSSNEIDSNKAKELGLRDVKENIGSGENPKDEKTKSEATNDKVVENSNINNETTVKAEKIVEIDDVPETVIPVEKTPEPVQVKAEIHKTWDDLTRKHISSSGKVNYAGFKADKDEIVKYIKELQSYHKDLSSWGKNKRLAYWINVYNAVTVKLIVDNYPLKSITDLYGGKPWDEQLINLGGTAYTLNVIEKKIIIAKFKEPRIHFAVNCAAVSCPKILNRAWTEDNVQRYLTKQTKAFFANTTENTIAEDKVVISKIFDWYKADFGTSNENVINFINKYSDTKVNSNAEITYNEYNWDLNN